MANYTGADVITASDVTKYQPDAFEFGLASGSTEVLNFLAQTTNDILRQLRIEWWPVYKTNVFTDITVLNTAEMVNTKVNLDQFERAGVYLFLGRFYLPALTKFRQEKEKKNKEKEMNQWLWLKGKKKVKWIWIKAKNNPMYSIPLALLIVYLIWK